MRALRVGPWRSIRKITRPPKEAKIFNIKYFSSCIFIYYSCLYKRQLSQILICHSSHFLKSFTSTRPFLLFLDAGSDGVVLLVSAPASSDLAENLTGLLAPALSEKPTGALRQEEEADELQHCRDNGQTQHVPTVWRERGGVKGRGDE